jgi:RNA polymerase sigma-70 factor (ECF subfamily)
VEVDDSDLARDRMLVEAWQAGDASAFDELYRRHFDRLRVHCARRIGDAAAEEVTQEAFVRALRALPRFEGERRFYPWLTVIANRLCIDHVRRHGRIEPTDRVDLGSVDDGHDARYALQADLANLDQAFSRLVPRHAEVLDLRERRGLTYDEIAGQLGVPHSTVETLLFRARKALRREFAAVSAERLAAVPGVGWLAARAVRWRDRVAGLDTGLSALGGAVAAGAVAVALVALPTPHHEPVAPVERAVAESPGAGVVVPVAPMTTASPARPSTPTTEVERPRLRHVVGEVVRPVPPEEAQAQASTMPLQLDLDQTGVGIDPTPILDRLRRLVP